jgi:hypothetical protein
LGDCYFALAFHIDRSVALHGLNFTVIGHTPAAMDEGDWSVGVIVDERATKEQPDALAAIGSGTGRGADGGGGTTRRTGPWPPERVEHAPAGSSGPRRRRAGSSHPAPPTIKA